MLKYENMLTVAGYSVIQQISNASQSHCLLMPTSAPDIAATTSTTTLHQIPVILNILKILNSMQHKLLIPNMQDKV